MGSTAAFAMEETYKMIQKKLESAERRAVVGFNKRGVKQFIAEAEPIPEEEYEFKKPESGSSSITAKGKVSAKTDGRLRAKTVDQDEIEITRSRRGRTPATPDHDDNLLDGDYDVTPSAFGVSNQSKKTRFGSTDN
jgi:hypothetical protein